MVRVRVVDVDKERRRIGLSMILEEAKVPEKKEATLPLQHHATPSVKPVNRKNPPRGKHQSSRPVEAKPVAAKKTIFNTTMADAFSKLKRGS